MRCHPGVSYPLERVVPAGGAAICGTHIKEGVIVGINPAVIHRDRTIFGEDALTFRPERWLVGDAERIKVMDRHLMTVRLTQSSTVTTYFARINTSRYLIYTAMFYKHMQVLIQSCVLVWLWI